MGFARLHTACVRDVVIALHAVTGQVPWHADQKLNGRAFKACAGGRGQRGRR